MKRYLSLFFLIAVLISCKKDDGGSGSGGVFIPPATTTCKVDVEELILDGDITNKEVIQHFYSNNLLIKRVSGNGTILFDSTEYLYNNNGQLKYVLETDFFTNLLDTTHILEYNNSGDLIRVVQLQSNNISAEFHLSYFNSNLFEFLADYKNFSSEKYAITTSLNGNITKIKLLEDNGQPVINGNILEIRYDDKINPLKGEFDKELQIWEMFSTNNVISLEVVESDSSTFSINHTYSYNDKNLPIVKFSNENNEYFEERTYTYTCD